MMSASKGMSAGAASSYFSKEDYYLRGAENSQWFGNGAASLGLSGPVSKDDFAALCAGVDPKTGETLVAGKADGQGNEERRAGNDYTFSAPKSLSIAYASGVEGAKEAHDSAVKAVAQILEQHYSQARTSEGLQAGSMVSAKFDHATSREGDPQLHSHLFVINAVQTSDGQWRANDPQNIYKDQKSLGELYRQELANQLQAQGFQLDWTDRKSLQFEIRGVSESAIKEFSARREAIESKVATWQAEGKHADLTRGQLYERAALETRSAKGERSAESVREQWQQGFAQAGTSPEQVRSEVETIREQTLTQRASEASQPTQPGQQPAATARTAEEVVKSAAEGLNSNEATFSRADIMRISAEISGGKHSLAELSSAVEAQTLKHGDEKGREIRTTQAMRDLEARNVEGLKTLANTEFKAVTSEAEVKQFLQKLEKEEGIKLSVGQAQHVTNELAGRSSLATTQGDPGTGKTFASSIVERFNNEILKPSGREHCAINVAFTGKAAAEMSEASGKTAFTIDSFLAAYERGNIQVVQPARAEQHQQAQAGRAERMTGTAGQHQQRAGEMLQTAERSASAPAIAAAPVAAKGYTLAEIGNSRDSGGKTTIHIGKGGMSLRFDETRAGALSGTKESSQTIGSDGSKTLYSGSKHGDKLIHTRDGKGTTTDRQGNRTEFSVRESGSQFLGFKKTERTERNDNQVKTTKSTTWGRNTKGITTTIHRDGKVVETKWEGQRGLLSGKFEITRSETITRIDEQAASKAFDSTLVRAGVAASKAVDTIREYFGGQKGKPTIAIPGAEPSQQPGEKQPLQAPDRQQPGGGDKQVMAIPAGAQVVIKIDEASFVGARHAEQLVKITNQLREQGVEAKILAVGDTKQLQSISAGRFFDQAQAIAKESGNAAALKDINRQKDMDLRSVAVTLNRDGDKYQLAANAREALQSLDRQGRITEIKGAAALKEATVAAYMREAAKPSNKPELAEAGQKQSVLVVTSTNRDRQELNSAIREARIAAGEIDRGQKFETLQQVQRGHTADSYKIGDQVQFAQNAPGVPNGVTASVTSVNPEKNTVQVMYSFERQGKEYHVTKDIQADKLSQNSTTFEKAEREFSVGDRVMTLKNDKELGVKNGQAGTIERIEGDKIYVKMDSGKSLEIDTKNYQNLDHGYASTVHKSQGATVESAIMHHNPEAGAGASYNSLNVAATRATHELHILTSDKEALAKQVGTVEEKSTTVEAEQLKTEKSDQSVPQPQVDSEKSEPQTEKSEPASEKIEDPATGKDAVAEKLESMDAIQRSVAEAEMQAANHSPTGSQSEEQQLATLEAASQPTTTTSEIEKHETEQQQLADNKSLEPEGKQQLEPVADLQQAVSELAAELSAIPGASAEVDAKEVDHESTSKSELESAIDGLKEELAAEKSGDGQERSSDHPEPSRDFDSDDKSESERDRESEADKDKDNEQELDGP